MQGIAEAGFTLRGSPLHWVRSGKEDDALSGRGIVARDADDCQISWVDGLSQRVGLHEPLVLTLLPLAR